MRLNELILRASAHPGSDRKDSVMSALQNRQILLAGEIKQLFGQIEQDSRQLNRFFQELRIEREAASAQAQLEAYDAMFDDELEIAADAAMDQADVALKITQVTADAAVIIPTKEAS